MWYAVQKLPIMPHPIPTSARVAVSHKQISCELAGEAVILHIARGRYYSLNGTGATAWQLMQQPCTVQSLVEHLVREYAVEEEVCRRDLQQLLQELLQADLIEVRE